MATITIRNLPEDVKVRLRVRAARRGRSMEAEARELLAAATAEPEPMSPEALRRLTEEVRAAFAPYRIEGASIVDELIAERRAEAWQETLEAQEWQRRQAKAKRNVSTDG